MRLLLTISFMLLFIGSIVAQPAGRRSKSTVYSASGEWQKITLQPAASGSSTPSAPVVQPNPSASQPNNPTSQPITPTTQPTESVVRTEPKPASTAPTTMPSSGFRPAFTGDFVTNRNGWKAGNKGDYNYQIGMGRYSIRKRKASTRQVAFSYVSLPNDINLNRDDAFTIKVDVMADSGRVPTGGLLFGVKDSLNFCAFTLNSKGETSIIRVTNGEAYGDYMPGDFFAPGVPVEKNRDRLTIRRNKESLSFYVNEQEVRGSPYAFKTLPGNGVGLITDASWTTFQKLTVTVGTSPSDPPPTPVSLPVTRPTTTSRSASPTLTTATNVSTVAANPPTKNDVASSTSALVTATRPETSANKPTNITFSELFADNQNKWLVGQTGGYEFEVAKSSYFIRKTSASTSRAGYGYINLPTALDLNKAESFTITVDMIVPPGIQPNAGLVIGVNDEDNLCEFRVADRQKVIVKSLRNGLSSPTYMPGKPIPARVPINQETNTLMIQKRNKKLYFYVNNREVESSPYEFKPFSGNKIGFVSAAQAVKFQNLKVVK
ncbi:hypothetical protein IC229_27840 [Spirosoma sp. BT702]|uniref:Uncharacterized protein n=1 Tax=Spirosoma profusum TaxID=2771354 RepID=A0A926Y0S5_9BACT|nr:hypothetical protein [Spirosoma profusum]MBD2704484.1 hypothetical protein [Spirosoma profusum]